MSVSIQTVMILNMVDMVVGDWKMCVSEANWYDSLFRIDMIHELSTKRLYLRLCGWSSMDDLQWRIKVNGNR